MANPHSELLAVSLGQFLRSALTIYVLALLKRYLSDSKSPYREVGS